MYLNDWKESKLEGLKSDFEINDDEILEGVEILLASYGYQDYSGDAFILFSKNGKLYEVNGSHCSCYGLEGQWDPEETTKEALLHRINNGELGADRWSGNQFKQELIKVLEEI